MPDRTITRLLFSLFACIAAITGCTSQRDYDELLASSLATLEREAPIEAIVLSTSLGPEARSSAKSLRKTIEQSEIVPSGGNDLPAGYFALKSVTISGSSAHVIGTSGPIPSKATLACGSSYDISFSRIDGHWQQGEMTVMVC
jgi:hypothetical protein